MRKLIILLVILFGLLLGSSTKFVSPAPSIPIDPYNITVTQINAEWNQYNSLPIENLKNCKVLFAFMEDQPQHIQEKYSKIPIIAISKNGKIIKLWEGDIMFKSTTTIKELQSIIDTLQ